MEGAKEAMMHQDTVAPAMGFSTRKQLLSEVKVTTENGRMYGCKQKEE